MAVTAQKQSDRLREQQAMVHGEMWRLNEAATGRNFSEKETAKFNELKAQFDAFDERIERALSDEAVTDGVNKITHGAGTQPRTSGTGGSSAGALFAAGTADYFKRGGHHTAGTWRTDALEVPYAAMLRGTTLTEDPASAGKLIVPQYLPGIIPGATRPIVVMDLLLPGTTDSNAVNYMKETTFTNAAAPVAEGIAKPESALVFDQVSEPVLKVACWLPCSEELLEDAPAISSYIDGRLSLGVQLAEDDQLLNGNGTRPNYTGLLNRAGLATAVVQGAGESVPDAILRQIGAISTTAMTRPTGIVMNPVDYLAMQIIKSTTGEYIGPSPFETPQVPTLWGLPVALTTAIVAKTALVGAFATMAQFFRKGGIRVEASNSHQDFFVKNLVAIRAEERGALAVFRPGAFGRVTLI